MTSVHSGSARAKPAPNMKNAIKHCGQVLDALVSAFGAEGQDGGCGKVPKEAIDKVTRLRDTLDRLHVREMCTSRLCDLYCVSTTIFR